MSPKTLPEWLTWMEERPHLLLPMAVPVGLGSFVVCMGLVAVLVGPPGSLGPCRERMAVDACIHPRHTLVVEDGVALCRCRAGEP